jgi:nucleotide-binding universal stress UspA family protein
LVWQGEKKMTIDLANGQINQNKHNQPLGFQKILVALDNSLTSEEIFTQALELAEKYQASLMICHCLQSQVPSSPELLSLGATGSIYSAQIWELEEQAISEMTTELQNWLASLKEKAKQKGIRTESNYVVGNPGEEICHLAESWQADLIIMGRRGLFGFSEMLFGSVSNYVFHHAPCAILILQHEDQEIN